MTVVHDHNQYPPLKMLPKCDSTQQNDLTFAMLETFALAFEWQLHCSRCR